MKRIIVLSLIFIGLLGIKLDVLAVATYAESSSDTYYTELKNGYDKGITKNNINSSGRITLYGKSVCSGTSCTPTYAGSISNFEDAIAKSVTCTNGEKYVVYQNAGTGKTNYLADNKAQFDGTAYWSEEYEITCTSTNTSGNTTVTLDSSTSTTTTTTQGGYSSSTTVPNEQTGVNTYFIVLGLVAIISYMIMLVVKKYNLFKKI